MLLGTYELAYYFFIFDERIIIFLSMNGIPLQKGFITLLMTLLVVTCGCDNGGSGNSEPGIPNDRARVVLSGDISDSIQSRVRPDFDDIYAFQFVDRNGNNVRDTTFGGFQMFWGDLDGSTVRLTVVDRGSTKRADTGNYLPRPTVTDTTFKKQFYINLSPNGIPGLDLVLPDSRAGTLTIAVNNDQQLKGTLNNVKLISPNTDTTCRVNGIFRISR
jgi:hypothetical protein